MSRSLEHVKEKIASLDAMSGYDAADDSERDDRIQTLKDVALTLLDEVEAMTPTRSVNIRHGINLYEEVQRFERDLIEQALERTGGHQTRAARLLGVNLTTLHNKIKRYRISVADWEENGVMFEVSAAQQ